jgi:aryl-alcohol dehydrogenase-like predicted oxidoreductase
MRQVLFPTLAHMDYKKYIPGSPPVSVIGMGTWQLGAAADWKPLSEKDAIYMVEEALNEGVTFFDTAPNYGQGASEERLGKALSHTDRSKVILNTKFGHTVDGNIDFDPGKICRSIEGSLRRLQTDYLDSVLFHNPPAELLNGNRAPEHYELLEELKAEGKILAYGASVDRYEEMKVFLDTTNGQVVEAFFNILHQDTGRAFEQAEAQGVAVIAKIPLDSGWLSWKYGLQSTFRGVRSRWSQADIEKRAALVEAVEEILAPGFRLPQAALAFCMAHDAVSTVIPGSGSLAQLRSNLRSLDKPLPPGLIRKLQLFYQEEVQPLGLPW